MTPYNHISWLIDTKERLQTSDGKTVYLFEFAYQEDEETLSAWAKHFRNHYCSDEQIDRLRCGTGFTRTQYLNSIKFPTSSQAPGPSIRAGDFGEILVADFLEYKFGYLVPRTRYDRKTIQNESTKGSDLIGFKMISDVPSPEDVLTIFEVKTQFSGKKSKPTLQEAVNHSVKDEIRKAESLNAIKQRLLDEKKDDMVSTVQRFQNPVDYPYIEKPGAAALFSSNLFDKGCIYNTCTKKHPKHVDLSLLVIHGQNFMQLVNMLYKRAADEA